MVLRRLEKLYSYEDRLVNCCRRSELHVEFRVDSELVKEKSDCDGCRIARCVSMHLNISFIDTRSVTLLDYFMSV